MFNVATDVVNTVRQALLLAVVANRPMMVFTGEQGDVPTYPGPGWVKVLDDDLRWKVVDTSSLHPVTKSKPYRALNRVYDGNAISVVTTLDPFCRIAEAIVTPARKPADPSHMPDFTGDAFYEPVEPTVNIAIVLPETELSEAGRNRAIVSLDLRSLSPSVVKELFNSVMESDEFSPDNVAALRAKHAAVLDSISPAFANRLDKAIRATRPDTVEFLERVSIGILPTFGYGASPRVAINVLHASVAHAVISGRDYVRSSDIVDVFPRVVSHAITWGAAKPGLGINSALTQIAEWAVSI